MKNNRICGDMEERILLADSGELPDGELQCLEQHLEACPHCAEYRRAARQIADSARQGLSANGPSPDALARIRLAAEQRATLPALILYRGTIVRTLAWAACAAVVLGIWFARPSSARDTRVDEVYAILDMVAEEDSLDVADREAEENRSLHSLARELLVLEGLAEDEEELDLFMEEEELLPTVLQYRSTDGCPPQRCV